MRQPVWRGHNKADWGLKPLSLKTAIRECFFRSELLRDYYRFWVNKRKVPKKLRQFETRRISLGSGTSLADGWIGFDCLKSGQNIFPVNLLLGFPLQDDSVHELLAEHILEHFFLDDIYLILKECYRTLKPEGKLRIICPDAKKIANLIMMEANAEEHYDVTFDTKIHRWSADGLRWARTINRLSHQWGQHKSLLTSNMIKQLLHKIGFKTIYQLPVKETKLFDYLPDIHHKRFSEESANLNFAIETKKG